MFCFVLDWMVRYIESERFVKWLLRHVYYLTSRPRKQIKVRHLSVNFDMCRDMWLIDITTFSFKKRDVCWFCMWMIAFFRAFYSRGHVNRTKFEIASEFTPRSSNFGRHQRLDLTGCQEWMTEVLYFTARSMTLELMKSDNPIPVAGEHWREYCAAKEQK